MQRLWLLFLFAELAECLKGGFAMKYGARNQLTGRVIEIKKGAMMCQVRLDIPADSKMSSVMTIDSLNDLGVKEGDMVRVIVKAVNVLLVKD
jgi:molybdate transport system regulatory protein